MAVKTQISINGFVLILSQYDLGSFAQAEAIQQGTVQTNYILQTSEGRFVFRLYENRSKESVLFESDLLEYLTNYQYPCPMPVRNIQGAVVGAYHNKPYVIFPFVEGQSVEKPTTQQWKQLIQKAAELQIITRNFQSPYTPYRMNYDAYLCFKLASVEAKEPPSADANAKLRWLEEELSSLQLPLSLPKGICHCDFHFSNILFKGNEFVALLDFDDANYTYLQFDLVGLIEYWAWRHPAPTIDVSKARKIVNAYEKHRLLASIEKNHLFDVYKLSILFDCVWYFNRGAVDDFYEKVKIDALNRLGRQAFKDALFER